MYLTQGIYSLQTSIEFLKAMSENLVLTMKTAQSIFLAISQLLKQTTQRLIWE